MRKFYLMYPIRSSIMSELSWTHYLEQIKIKKIIDIIENEKKNIELVKN